MPPFPGEDRLVTVFADIHYYFAQPTVRPLLHRFDKGSYFYIYYNATRHTSRIEVANNPGTPDQDAFNGYIDSCRMVNSSKFPTQLTIIIDGTTPQSPSSPVSGRERDEWHLTSGDPRDPNRNKYRLHTIDCYFWALEDARLVIECFKKLLPASQLDVADLEPEPEPEPEPYPHQIALSKSPVKPASAMSPVVQNLENLAVQDHSYDNQSKKGAVSPSSSFNSHNVPPPPPGGPSGQQIQSPSPAISDMSSQPARKSSVKSNTQPQASSFAPMAYNPAAPPAPEPISHREKTPPPEDGTAGTGLAQAARHDQGYVSGQPAQRGGYQVGQGPPNLFGGGYASPPPPPQPGQPGYGSPPPPSLGSSHGYNAPPSNSTVGYTSPPPPASFSYGGQQEQRNSQGSATAPSFGPGAVSTVAQQGHRQSSAAETYVPVQPNEPAMTPGSQFYGSLSQPSKPLAHVQPQYADYLSAGSPPPQQLGTYQPPPPGGYSQFSYGQSPPPQQHGQSPYDVHQQVYRPTEAEAKKPHGKPSASDNRRPSTIDKVEGRAKGLFKKLEKRIG